VYSLHLYTPPDLDRRVEELTKLCDGGWTTSKFAPADAAFDAGAGAPKLSALDVLALHVGGAHVVRLVTRRCFIPASHTHRCCDLHVSACSPSPQLFVWVFFN
jgi:hypothetical protein